MSGSKVRCHRLVSKVTGQCQRSRLKIKGGLLVSKVTGQEPGLCLRVRGQGQGSEVSKSVYWDHESCVTGHDQKSRIRSRVWGQGSGVMV